MIIFIAVKSFIFQNYFVPVAGVLYPDSVVGTDSHTTMINGLGVVGWGVGGIEAEAVMLGQPISMTLPKVPVTTDPEFQLILLPSNLFILFFI